MKSLGAEKGTTSSEDSTSRIAGENETLAKEAFADAVDNAKDAVEGVLKTGVAVAAAAGAGLAAMVEQKLQNLTAEPIDFSKVKIEPLFEEEVDFDTFSKSDFRAVKVKECVAVPKSKKLLQFTLDDGSGTDRTILSGIHAYYEPEELVGKTCICITGILFIFICLVRVIFTFQEIPVLIDYSYNRLCFSAD